MKRKVASFIFLDNKEKYLKWGHCFEIYGFEKTERLGCGISAKWFHLYLSYPKTTLGDFYTKDKRNKLF